MDIKINKVKYAPPVLEPAEVDALVAAYTEVLYISKTAQNPEQKAMLELAVRYISGVVATNNGLVAPEAAYLN